jgi:hypothetical protein
METELSDKPLLKSGEEVVRIEAWGKRSFRNVAIVTVSGKEESRELPPDIAKSGVARWREASTPLMVLLRLVTNRAHQLEDLTLCDLKKGQRSAKCGA